MKPSKSFVKKEQKKTYNWLIIACFMLSMLLLSFIKTSFCPAPSSPDNEDKDTAGATKPLCDTTGRRSSTCDVEGDVRIHGSSGTIVFSAAGDDQQQQQQWKIKPYARKHDPVASANIKEWSLKPFAGAGAGGLPNCTKTHDVPAVVFSIGGFTGNFFHDFTDILVPLFTTARQFDGDVQFIVSDVKSWWIGKFKLILGRLSKRELIDAGDEEGRDAVHCFRRVIIGPMFHKELGIDSAKSPKGYSIADFRTLLRDSFGLRRKTVAEIDAERPGQRPRLLIISRKRSRAFVNAHGMEEMARSIGYDVVSAEPGMATDIAKFARLVNSADVMVGVHGAGLTNMVFLPDKAVVIQVIPLGGLEYLARDSFKEPALEMDLHYLEYVLREDESTLSDVYPKDHPVIKDPMSVHKKGWDALKEVYLDKQNVKPHLGRLREKFMEALKLLQQQQQHD
ncbi:hypothetical protein QJS10_CPA01g01397 [Acorus calamus]|uniref:Glycosyltransferase 61 catalytic domain-containing protein n=1 Tax=Acorus calamus TaxID=4465 RepID=A0AAV9FL48_ACOCL|nr:hypothetical protein QJS10_CPA01g01397 [Acorus calamus]